MDFKWIWYNPDFLDIHVFFPLIERLKNADFIQNMAFKRCLDILKNHSKANEMEAAITWFNQEKNKLENELKKDGHQLVNFDDFIEDHFEGHKDNVTSSIMSLLFGFGGKTSEQVE